MLLSITNHTQPATDLGYLLHKHPDKVQSFDLTFGRAHVLYSEATTDRCTAHLILDVDPVGLVRGRRGPAGERFALEQYVNDRAYVASSFMSVAFAEVLGSALNARCNPRPELVDRPLDLEVHLPSLACRGGETLVRGLFEPLGYQLTYSASSLDAKFAEWGDSLYADIRLRRTGTLAETLGHVYVLVPVLDREKHYWVGPDELEKLLKRGDGWLADHPQRETIVARYLKYNPHLTREAIARLVEEETPELDAVEDAAAEREESVERTLSLHEQRIGTVTAVLRAVGARRIVDLGCGEGRLIRALLADSQFEKITGVDVSHRALAIAADRLRLDRMPPKQRERIELLHGSLVYRDGRIAGFDAAAVVEVIEHLDPHRLAAFERVLFEFARPRVAVITTPNAEYNVKFDTLGAGEFRHGDHRFEWTRSQFETWATGVADRFGYRVRFAPIGPLDTAVGSPTQMAVFELQ